MLHESKSATLHDKKKYKTTQLVVINASSQSDGYSTYFGNDITGYIFYEKVDLKSYPSHNDFLGNEVRLKNGDKATIIRELGYPERLLFHAHRNEYNLYEILVNGAVCQIFQKDISSTGFPEHLDV